MSDLGDELHRLADQGAQEARPLPPSEVIRRGLGARAVEDQVTRARIAVPEISTGRRTL